MGLLIAAAFGHHSHLGSVFHTRYAARNIVRGVMRPAGLMLIGTRIMAIIFKIMRAAEWAEATTRGAFEGSPDDCRDGYIHLSAADQVQGTFDKYFSAFSDCVLVAFEANALGGNLKWEASRGEQLFPHLYGPLPVSHALWARPIPTPSGGAATIDKAWLQDAV